MCFIQCAEPVCYGELLDELSKGILKGHDEFPKTVAAAYNLMLHTSHNLGYKKTRQRYRNGTRGSTPQNFVLAQKGNKGTINVSGGVPGKDRVLHEGIKCYACQEIGHYSSQCLSTEESKAGFELTQQNHLFD